MCKKCGEDVQCANKHARYCELCHEEHFFFVCGVITRRMEATTNTKRYATTTRRKGNLEEAPQRECLGIGVCLQSSILCSACSGCFGTVLQVQNNVLCKSAFSVSGAIGRVQETQRLRNTGRSLEVVASACDRR